MEMNSKIYNLIMLLYVLFGSRYLRKNFYINQLFVVSDFFIATLYPHLNVEIKKETYIGLLK